MHILTTSGFKDYQLLDSGHGQRLERVQDHTFVRPDPQCLWSPALPTGQWQAASAIFEKRLSGSREQWYYKKRLPDRWPVQYGHLTFYARCTPFKHLGFFPEQHLHWDWMTKLIAKANRPIKVLNLFAYTGIATSACASAGAQVTHVDASKPAITWARDNAIASNLDDKPIRWIEDDCLAFVQREARRGNKYDAILMDPPVYGHGPNGKPWDFMKDFPQLLQTCTSLLSPNPLFLLINAYAISASSIMLENMLKALMSKFGGQISAGELCLQESSARRNLLSTGLYARWSENSK